MGVTDIRPINTFQKHLPHNGKILPMKTLLQLMSYHYEEGKVKKTNFLYQCASKNSSR